MSRMAQQAALIGMARGQNVSRRVGVVMMYTLLALLAAHVAAVCLDFMACVHYGFELDYGEGIVWQQAALIPGSSMYGTSTALPFIVFHYPPLYYLIAKAASLVEPNLLAAGRLVSVISTLMIAPAVAGLVLVSVRPGGQRLARVNVQCAIVAGLLVLSLHAVHSWGLLMRVDMLAVALGMLGLLLGAWADGRFVGTTVALLLCVASVFTKQTQLPAGLAVFVIAVLRNPRATLGAAALAGAVGLAALGFLQWQTQGGFLGNIIGFNINRFAPFHVLAVLLSEYTSLLLMAFMVACAIAVLHSLRRHSAGAPWQGTVGRWIVSIRAEDSAMSARRMLLLYSILSSIMLVSIFKSGSASNYFIPCLCAGCVLIGVRLCDLAVDGRQMVAGLCLLLLCILPLPFRLLLDQASQEDIEQQAALVQRIAAAGKPVASENMTLLMLAGKPVIFEPAIIAELASLGRWDEAPLTRMIRTGGFAFMITVGDDQGGNARRTAAVDAAMREAYPHVEQVTRRLWVHTLTGS